MRYQLYAYCPRCNKRNGNEFTTVRHFSFFFLKAHPSYERTSFHRLRFIYIGIIGHTYTQNTRTYTYILQTYKTQSDTHTHTHTYRIYIPTFFYPLYTLFLYIDDYIDGKLIMFNKCALWTYISFCLPGWWTLTLIILPRLVVVIFVDAGIFSLVIIIYFFF